MRKQCVAVKAGDRPGIYLNMEQAKKAIGKYPYPQYKKFENDKQEEAKAYLSGFTLSAAYTKEQVRELEACSEAFAYTDGSAFMQDDRYAYAAILFTGGQEIILSGSGKGNLKSAEGEMEAVLVALERACMEGIKEITLFYDYDVLGKILFSETNSTPLWNGYVRRIRQFSKEITIRFIKIKSHGFCKNNRRVDKLARGELNHSCPAQK